MKSNAARDLVIGFIFLGALAVLGLATLQGGDISLWAETTEITVPFQRVDGLAEGDPVRYQGLSVGQVVSLVPEFSGAEPSIQVKCRLDRDFPLPLESRFEVRSASALGGRLVEIVPGPDPTKTVAAKDGAFRGQASGDLFEQVNALISEVREGNGLIAQLIKNEQMGTDFSAMVGDLRTFAGSLNEGDGALQSFLRDPKLRDRIVGFIDDISVLAKDIREGKGILGMLISDDKARVDATNLVEHFEDILRAIRESRGSIGKWINSSDLHDSIQEVVDSIKRVTASAGSGDGTFAMLVNDAEFRDSLRNAVKHIEDSMSGVAAGKGTVGRLMQEDEVYERLRRILIQAEDGLEDFREQAPISTFIDAIFTAF
jgi:phospholipid/cholesterol/gamma-HCH transport system substrate-binding protein